MADAPAFDFVCSQLQERTTLDRLEARGTIRLALREAGLDARSVSPDQMSVVVEKLLPRELESRGVADAGSLCAELRRGLLRVERGDATETPEAVFQRLGT